MKESRRPRRGDEVELVIEGVDARGHGVATLSADRVRVPGAVPGARVRAQVRRRRRGAIDADLLETVERGPWFVEPRCAHAASCGGCSFQHLAYEAQLAQLGALLERTLRPLAADGALAIEPVAGCDDPWNYRNKMDFTFANRRWIEPGEEEGADAHFALGLHAPGRHDKVLDVERCDIAFAEASAILATARRLAREQELAPWDLREHAGLLRHLVLRKSFATGEILVSLVTSDDAPAEVEPYAAALLAAHPEITTFVQSVNTRPASIAVGERERVLHGEGFITEELAGLRFRISAASFFQTNTAQADRLARTVARRASTDGTVYDLCCGAGVLGLAAAASASRVVGFELVPAAVADARRNAGANGVANARFVEGDLAATLPEFDGPPPDVCIADPPRAGLHPRVIAALRRLRPARLVYVSCNPAAAVRDLLPLRSDGYRVVRVEPLDLFPHTPHLECVLTLEGPAEAR